MLIKSTVVLLLVSTYLMSPVLAQNKKEYIILSGTIENVEPLPGGKKAIELKPPFGVNRLPRTIVLSESGSFADTLRTIDGEYALWDGKNPVPIYLRRGKTYVIHYDADNFRNGSLEVAGDDVPMTKYFAAKLKKKIFIDRLNLNRSEDQFRALIKQIRQEALDRLQLAKLPRTLNQKEAKSIQYEYLSELYLFLALKKEADPTFEPSAHARKELAINYLNEPDYKQDGYYQKLVFEYYQTQLKQVLAEKKKTNPAYSLEQHEPQLLFGLVPNPYIRNHLIAQRAMYGLKEAGDLETYYRDFRRYYTGNDVAFKAEMADAYWRLSKLKVGRPSPEFVNYRNYQGGQVSLRDFRGKYVYIDLWATWCGNCWGEMPFLQKLEQAYQGKNIAFISISLDKNARQWVATVAEKRLAGVQLLANQKDQFFLKEYAVNGIPRYILLDPKGTIVAYSAPRPSETQALRKLLTKAGI